MCFFVGMFMCGACLALAIAQRDVTFVVLAGINFLTADISRRQMNELP
jgi:hypothetical protein